MHIPTILPPTVGADLSFVIAFFNFVPRWISLNNRALFPLLFWACFAGLDVAGGGGGGGGGGGTGILKFIVSNYHKYGLIKIQRGLESLKWLITMYLDLQQII